MGAYAPVSISNPDLLARVEAEILLPTLAALREHGRPFTGLLYAGLMITADGPKVVEFNCRFGDPETQAILPILESDLLGPLAAVATGSGIGGLRPFQWNSRSAVTTVVAAAGYPAAPRLGDTIDLPPVPSGVTIFHAGTQSGPDGTLRTAGGRVFAVTAVADSIQEARAASVATADRVRFEGSHFRRDIGWRESERHAGAS